MNQPSLYQTQANSLISQLRQEQNERSRLLHAEAAAWARQRLREARRKARLLIADTVIAEREHLRKEIAAAEASIMAQQRHRHQVYIARVLATVMTRIPEMLAQRWKEQASRQAWLRAALGEAERRLGVCEWRIRHAPGLGRDDISALQAGGHAHWLEDAALEAGLIIEKQGARLDASVAGLMADPVDLHGRILTLLQTVRASETDHE